jgi:hypothetical protein
MTSVPKRLTVSVDRIERSTVVLEGEDGRAFKVPVKTFPVRPSEGMLYRVPLDAAGKPLWSQAVGDPEAAERLKKELAARMKSLRATDPGGDVKL